MPQGALKLEYRGQKCERDSHMDAHAVDRFFGCWTAGALQTNLEKKFWNSEMPSITVDIAWAIPEFREPETRVNQWCGFARELQRVSTA